MPNKPGDGQITAKELYESFVKNGINYFCGVPDTTLSPVGLFIEENAPHSHDVAINEGSAVAMAIGHHIATSEIPLVYMQNSGLGNAINPLTSLADPLVMSIPMLLVIGWRGQPGKKDEPQHQKQGRITVPLLQTLGIPFITMSHDPSKAIKQISAAIREIKESNQPYAIIIENNSIRPYENRVSSESRYKVSRELAIKCIIESLDDTDAVVATTGKASRELFELRDVSYRGNHKQDLLIVGGMGHASAIALSIAKNKPTKKIYCVDGDGAVLMHMGVLAAIGKSNLKNFYHIVINNGAHESVGGQRTLGFDVDLVKIAEACGYAHAYSLSDLDSLKSSLIAIKKQAGPIFMEIRTNTTSRNDLSRPDVSPKKNKQSFMKYLEES